MTETLKVGARVRVLDSHDGEITYGPFKSAFGRYTMYVVRNGSGIEHSHMDSDLEPLPKFVVGDVVRNPLTRISGPIVAGPFVACGDRERYWVVEQPDGSHSTPREDGLTRVEAREIKVGDRVKVIDADGRDKFVGRIGVVTRLDEGSELPYLVEFGDGQGIHGAANGQWWCGNVELVGESSCDTFKHDGVTYDLNAKYRDKDGDVWRFELVKGVPRGGISVGGPINEWNESLSSVVDDFGPLTKI